jgi:hypothetical protein
MCERSSNVIQSEPVATIPLAHLPKDYPLSWFPENSYPSSHWLQTSGDSLAPRDSGVSIEKLTCCKEKIPLYVVRERQVAVWHLLGDPDIPWYDNRNDLEGHFPFALRLPAAMREALRALSGRERFKVLGRY